MVEELKDITTAELASTCVGSAARLLLLVLLLLLLAAVVAFLLAVDTRSTLLEGSWAADESESRCIDDC